jgi:steroid delta-isomerase-like uncharacterized protein
MATDHTSQQREYEKLVRHRFAELDKQNFGIFDDLFASSYVLHLPGRRNPLDLAGTKRLYRRLYAAFPDLEHSIVQQVSDGNRVVTVWEASGTHSGDFMGVPATNKRVRFSGINVYRVSRGKLAESHVTWDLLTLGRQLGVVPAHARLP